MKKLICVLLALCFLFIASGCGDTEKKPKVGVSFGVGDAARWVAEKAYMEERAKDLGIPIEARFSKIDAKKTQQQDCIELIDSGINVLIITPSPKETHFKEILEYAKSKKVRVIAYARPIMNEKIDLFVGYDTYRIGQSLGQYLSEKVFKGDFILLKGDANDFNTPSLYNGAAKFIEPMVGSGVRVILDDYVSGWSPKRAKEMVKEAVSKNDGKIDAILCPNDALAGGAAAALEELHITHPVVITGMDAELAAIKRIVSGKQDVTVYMDLKSLAYTAIDEANNMIVQGKPNTNAEVDNQSDEPLKAYLISGQLITKENIDKLLIESGRFSLEDVYSKNASSSETATTTNPPARLRAE